MRPRKRSTPGLMTRKALQAALGVPRSTWEHHVEAGLPIAKRGSGNTPHLYDPEAVRSWLAAREEPDPDLRGPSSPALEEYRKEKAREAKRRNDVEEGKLVDIETVRRDLATIFGAYRARLEAVERTHGPQVGDSLRAALAETEAVCKAKWGMP